MFGYILPEKPELKIREYELFRAYYCGVCKSIGKRFGHIPRFTLNYDSTFLALLLSSMTGGKLCIKNERCIAHPLKKSKVIRNDQLIDYASDINIILAYYNLEDNWKDEKSVPSFAAMTVLRGAFKKLKVKYGRKCGIIEQRLKELTELEKNQCCSVDMAAEPFAKLMEEITAYEPLCSDEKNEKILRWLGYNLGKWIYILDAYDDIEKDIKNKSYNPFVCQYDFKGSISEAPEFKQRIREAAEFNLVFCLNQIARAHDLLEIKSNQGVIENIVYMGMLRKTEQILKLRSSGEVEKSV